MTEPLNQKPHPTQQLYRIKRHAAINATFVHKCFQTTSVQDDDDDKIMNA